MATRFGGGCLGAAAFARVKRIAIQNDPSWYINIINRPAGPTTALSFHATHTMAGHIRPESHTGQTSGFCEKHTDLWRFISAENDIKVLNQAVSARGNAFLIGKDLEHLYNGLRSAQTGASRHRHHLILSWESAPEWLRIDWSQHKTFMEIHYRNPNIILKYSDPNYWRAIQVDDLSKYVQNEFGSLRTKILYFKDEEFQLRTLDLTYMPSFDDDLETTEHCYYFEMGKKHSRCTPEIFYLYEKDSLSTPKKPKIPWHERN
ncbi:hypothetical protein MRS44_013574 [Fusarium solani]|uniref:uncharacterized protein n=1 Tax=Fusarium solani TaxID=169388 RepID=UPI0032C3D62E|nr:hypothetical protein MRS44_013543 [Fusarium solani]KAJ3454974.1 hypothetical protein MRS44_013574 [Fusarium solani]